MIEQSLIDFVWRSIADSHIGDALYNDLKSTLGDSLKRLLQYVKDNKKDEFSEELRRIDEQNNKIEKELRRIQDSSIDNSHQQNEINNTGGVVNYGTARDIIVDEKNDERQILKFDILKELIDFKRNTYKTWQEPTEENLKEWTLYVLHLQQSLNSKKGVLEKMNNHVPLVRSYNEVVKVIKNNEYYSLKPVLEKMLGEIDSFVNINT